MYVVDLKTISSELRNYPLLGNNNHISQSFNSEVNCFMHIPDTNTKTSDRLKSLHFNFPHIT